MRNDSNQIKPTEMLRSFLAQCGIIDRDNENKDVSRACDLLDSLKSCKIRNYLISIISSKLQKLREAVRSQSDFSDITDLPEKKNVYALLKNVTDSNQINLLKRFFNYYPDDNSSYKDAIALLLIIKKFNNDDIEHDALRNVLAFIYQHQEQITFNADLFEKLKENSIAITQLDTRYSCGDAFNAEEVNEILSGLNKESNLPTSRAVVPLLDLSLLPTPRSSNTSDPSRRPPKVSPVVSNAQTPPPPIPQCANDTRSSKIALVAGLGLMAAGAMLAVFSAFALAGTGGLSSVLSAAGLFASYKMIMTGILLAVGTETFFLGEKAMLRNCNCTSFFGKKSAPAAAASSSTNDNSNPLMMSDNPPPIQLFRVLT